MDFYSNDPLFGGGSGGSALWDVDSECLLKSGDSFDMEKYLTGQSSGDLSWANSDEVDELASDLFKTKVEVTDQGVVDEKISGNPGGSISPKIESPNPAISISTTPQPTRTFAYQPRVSVELPDGPYEQRVLIGKSMRKQPRKYMLKPAEVKKNPVYRHKREKNNDAVRKCREKAKQEQKQKDDLLEFYSKENEELRAQIQELQHGALNCQCGVFVVEVSGEE